ncbi:A disintegrin and metalloproteinase with thrombospondin motifs 18, partial [Tachysurus ichikawai]
DICKSLWCHRLGHRCETKFMPAAEGTTCGPDMVSDTVSFDLMHSFLHPSSKAYSILQEVKEFGGGASGTVCC